MAKEARDSTSADSPRSMGLRAVAVVFILLLGWLIRFHNLTGVLVEGRFYFVDADCYSRMSRVREVAAHPGSVVRMHWFENWPEGVASHATSPLDYSIYLLSFPVRWLIPDTGRWSVLAGQSLDASGALVGPFFGMIALGAVAAAAGLFDGAQKARLEPGAFVSLFLAAVSPALVHATVFGRPDHQAPLVALLGVALCAEMRLAAGARQAWAWAGGVALGLALWVSWFEPAVFTVLIGVCGFFGWPHTWSFECRKRWVLGVLGCVALGVAVDGYRVAFPRAEFWELLQRWGASIGELQGTDLPFGVFRWTGGLLLGVPVCVALSVRGWDRRVRAELAWFGMLAVLVVLTVWQIRWSPYLALVFSLVVPAILRRISKPRVRAALVGVSLLPVAAEWDERWFPSSEAFVDRHLDRSERITLRLTAERLRSQEIEPFVAPWWHAPALAYWSGQPCIAGSSHQAIAGIRDSARIYLGTDPAEVRALLRERQVRVVVAGDRARIVENSTQILGGAPGGKPLADLLWSADIPPRWGLHGESNVTTFRLVRVLP